MTENVTAYPLDWPVGRPRRAEGLRKDGSFNKKRANGRYVQTLDITIADALERLQHEIDLLGPPDAILSSNVPTRLDGRPRSNVGRPSDPGVALYFTLAGDPVCLPCDTYRLVAHNIAAIAAHISSTRAIERHGVASVREMFSGFTALPAPGKADSAQWWLVLGVDPDAGRAAIEAAYRAKATKLHPDRPGGSAAAMAELNSARDEALTNNRKK